MVALANSCAVLVIGKLVKSHDQTECMKFTYNQFVID